MYNSGKSLMKSGKAQQKEIWNKESPTLLPFSANFSSVPDVDDDGVDNDGHDDDVNDGKPELGGHRVRVVAMAIAATPRSLQLQDRDDKYEILIIPVISVMTRQLQD